MNRSFSGRAAVVYVALAAFLLAGTPAQAITHANKYSVPLTLPYAHCGDETSETDCPGATDPLSPWEFSQGTVEVTSSTIGLKLDNISLRYNGSSADATCSDVGGGASACRCWGSDGSLYCEDNGDCGSQLCGPNSGNASDNDYFKVVVWFQAYHPGGVLCGNGGFCPHVARCVAEAEFDLKHTTGSKNEDVDGSESFSLSDCGSTYYGDFKREVRHVEVYDKWDNLVAVSSHF